MSDWKTKLGETFKRVMDNEIIPGDETLPANSLRNYLIDKTGMSKDLMESTADQKSAMADLPRNMGMGSMGSIGVAEGALSKLLAAKQAGQKLSAAEEYLLSKATGKVPVVKTAQEMAEPVFGKLKTLLGK